MNFYFPFLDDAGFILLIPPILIFAWIVTSRHSVETQESPVEKT